MKDISALPEFLKGFLVDVRQVMIETAYRVKTRMAEPGAPSSSPKEWDTDRQRKAFFASDGFGGGVPYERTGAYQASWTVERQPLGAVLYAPHPAGAIGGMPSGNLWQSSIHRGRWNYLPRILFEEIGKIPTEIANRFEIRSRT